MKLSPLTFFPTTEKTLGGDVPDEGGRPHYSGNKGFLLHPQIMYAGGKSRLLCLVLILEEALWKGRWKRLGEILSTVESDRGVMSRGVNVSGSVTKCGSSLSYLRSTSLRSDL